MGALHWTDLLVLALVGIIFFGPKRLPEMGASLGKTIREFQKSMREVTDPGASSSLPQNTNATVTPVAPVSPAVSVAEPVVTSMAAESSPEVIEGVVTPAEPVAPDVLRPDAEPTTAPAAELAIPSVDEGATR